MKSYPAILSALLLAAVLFCGCGKDSAPVAPENPAPTVQPEPAPEPEISGVLNPLTGIFEEELSEEAAARKPVAIMINNLKKALPQRGISQADILYEMQAEGGITRLLAIFQDPSAVEEIGTVRSSRSYYIDMAQSHNAVYLHFGASQIAYDTIRARSGELIALDGIRGGYEGTLYYRDKARIQNAGYEHSVFTTGERIEETLQTLNRDLSNSSWGTAYSFSEEHSAKSGQSAAVVTVPHSNYITAEFRYDPETRQYFRWQYGQEHYDEAYDCQLAFQNVIIPRMQTGLRGGDSYGWMKIQTTGTGDGYYCCEGKYVPITWSKDRYDAPIKYYQMDGSELAVCPGKTFVCVAKTDTEISFS